MRNEPGKLAAGADLAGVHLTGMVEGDAFVRQGGEAVVDGMVVGSLTIGPGCVVRVNGTVTGDLISSGAVQVAGVVNGAIVEQVDGCVTITSGAVVGGLSMKPDQQVIKLRRSRQ